MGGQVEKIMEFQGIGEVTRSPLERKIQWGGGVTLEKNPPWGVWIFSRTTHSMVVSLFCNMSNKLTSYLLFVHMLIFLVP